MTEHALILCREPGRHSTLDKGHEEGGSAYANAGSSLRNPPGCSRATPPHKTQSLPNVLLCALTSDSLGAVPHHHLALSVKQLPLSLLLLNTGRKKAESFLSSQFVGNNTQMWKKESLLMPLSFSRIPHQPFLTFSCSALDHIPIPKSIFGKEDGISHIPLSQ